jgi:hypothetical protein
MAPLEAPPGIPTNDLRQNTQKRNLIIIGSMFAVMIVALVGLLIFFISMRTPDFPPPPPPPPVAEVPPVPGVPVVPVPPAPPAPPGVGGQPAIDPSLIYPGARQTMSVNQEGGKGMVQLVSNDAASKVADWYAKKLKTTEKVTVIGQTILKAGDITVLIMGSEDGAQIIITRGGD